MSNRVSPMVTDLMLKPTVGLGMEFSFLPFPKHSTNAVFPLPSNPTTSTRNRGGFGAVCGMQRKRVTIRE